MNNSLLPDDIWMIILEEWIQDAVEWTQVAQTCRQLYRLPRPRAFQLVSHEVRYPHVFFLEIFDRSSLQRNNDVQQENQQEHSGGEHEGEAAILVDDEPTTIRLLCHNEDFKTKGQTQPQGEHANTAVADQEESVMQMLCGKRNNQAFRIFTYCEGDRAYLEPSFFNSAFHCEKAGERRKPEGYGLVLQYDATAVKEIYEKSCGYGRTGRHNECYWFVQERGSGGEDNVNDEEKTSPWTLRYGAENASMVIDFDVFFKAFLSIDGDSICVDCRLEDYRADLPFFLSRTPPVWHEQWRQRLYQAIPCQPRPFISHSFQTNVFAPDSWDDVDYLHDSVTDLVLTGHRTAAVKFFVELIDSHIIIRSPPQTFALRLPLLQDDLVFFRSTDPAAWLRHLYERRSRRWFVARKYFRAAADVQETGREMPVQMALRHWPVLHPHYVYQTYLNRDFLVTLPGVEIAKDPDTQEFIQQSYTANGELPSQKAWCVVLHG